MTLRDRLARALEIGAGGTANLVADVAPARGTPSPAAVLVAITDRPQPGVILTQRTTTLRRHAGEVAFPGGRIDPADAGPVAAALREAEEEIGLPGAVPDVIGTMAPYVTRTGFSIVPVISVIPPDLTLAPHAAEVAMIFEVDLAHLLDEANHLRQQVVWDGSERVYYEIPHPGPRIWGVTAGMIVNLARRLDRATLGLSA